MALRTCVCLFLPLANAAYGNVFGRVCLCVCLSVMFQLLKALTHEVIFWCAGMEYVGEVHMSRSSSQGQGHMSKKRVSCSTEAQSCYFDFDFLRRPPR